MANLAEVDRIHAAAAASGERGWHLHRVPWPELRDYHLLLKSFEKSLEEHGLVEEWATFRAYGRRIRFLLSTTPISPPGLVAAMAKWKTGPRPELARLRASAPPAIQELFDLLDLAFKSLQSNSESPLWKTALETMLETSIGQELSSIAVLMPDSRLLSALEELFSAAACHSQLNFSFVRAADLKHEITYDQLIVFGPTRRLHGDGLDSVLKCPRANAPTLFTPDIYQAEVPSFYELAGSPHLWTASRSPTVLAAMKEPVIILHQLHEADSGQVQTPRRDIEENDDWLELLPLPRIDYRPFNDSGEVSRDDAVFAKQFYLSADQIVYLAEDGSVYRLTEEAKPGMGQPVCENVEHIEVIEVGVGDILLFAEEGGGRMIQQVANQILGSTSAHFRSLQELWKSAYTANLKAVGDARIVKRLEELGAKAVTLGMVRNWRRELNIGPGSWRNFEALLKFCGLHDHREEIFNATRAIRSAHIQAGAQLAARLREKMVGHSLGQLHSEGMQVFGGSESVPTRKIAFFVVGISPDPLEVHSNDIAKPVPISSWR
jgi:hypothetical protein